MITSSIAPRTALVALICIACPGIAGLVSARQRAAGSGHPVVTYSTYFGRTSCADVATSVAVDADGNSVVAGHTCSSDFPTTPGALQTTATGGTTLGFVAKVSADGTRLIWATYVGGRSYTECAGVALDPAGNVYVTGTTAANDLPTPNGFIRSGGASDDAFLLKLDATSSRVLYGTYLGGSSDEFGLAVTVDGAGSAYVVGETSSQDFRVTPNALQTSWHQAANIAFAMKIDTTKAGDASLLYSTLLGGAEPNAPLRQNAGTGVALGPRGLVYVCGWTNYRDFPTTEGAIKSAGPANPGDSDGFLVALDPSKAGAASLAYGTLVGTDRYDVCTAVAVGRDSEVYLVGTTQSEEFPVTDGAFRGRRSGGFLVALEVRAREASVRYASVVGGSELLAVGVDAEGRATVAGSGSVDNIPLRHSIYLPRPGVRAALIARLTADGSDLDYSTLFGGGYQERALALALDRGVAHVVLDSASARVPLTPNTLAAAPPGGSSSPVGMLIRVDDGGADCELGPFADVAVEATTRKRLRAGAVVELSAEPTFGSECDNTVVDFSPASGSFFRLGTTNVVASLRTEKGIVSARGFDVVVSPSFDVCATAENGDRLQIVTDPSSQLVGYWQVVIPCDDVVRSGFSDSVTTSAGGKVVYRAANFKAAYDPASNSWTVKLTVSASGNEGGLTYRFTAANGGCAEAAR